MNKIRELKELHRIATVLITPDGTELVSRYRHEYITYTDKNGKEYMIDGGVDYTRSSNNKDEQFMTVDTNSPFPIIREYMYWGKNYDENGNLLTKTEYIRLADLGADHIRAILKTQKQLPEWRKKLFKEELKYR